MECYIAGEKIGAGLGQALGVCYSFLSVACKTSRYPIQIVSVSDHDSPGCAVWVGTRMSNLAYASLCPWQEDCQLTRLVAVCG